MFGNFLVRWLPDVANALLFIQSQGLQADMNYDVSKGESIWDEGYTQPLFGHNWRGPIDIPFWPSGPNKYLPGAEKFFHVLDLWPFISWGPNRVSKLATDVPWQGVRRYAESHIFR